MAVKKKLTDEERLEKLYGIYDGALIELEEKNESGKMKGTSALASQIEKLQAAIEKQIVLSGKGGGSEEVVITFEGFDMAETIERLAQERLEEMLRERKP